ncbi:hypothetical protein LUZ63_004982 [Rhynchospora breviuscula]|uniref:Uncharacterized protein n=1 Tax=Rhynchospora breviuscula TaxID=2022672 RepID=A0A9Q0CMI7_9POAL|nr:hypothetical protein LUZ63_004982 [Rhynchospora breviuscula]
MKGTKFAEMHGDLVFAINGERFVLSDLDPSMTLLRFLRTQTRFKGPKLGCGEGGCGACVVLLSKFNPITNQVSDFSVSSCLTLLASINHCSITTTEGLGNTSDGYHAIHHRFAGFHASQCGFCTPGMCMSLFSSLINADKDKRRPKQRDGFSKITVPEAERAISGNLCRCTGYRPIVDVCKSFAAGVDIEDLGFNSFQKKGGGGDPFIELPFYSPGGLCTFPEFLKTEIKSSTPCQSLASGRWHCPQSIEELCNLLNCESLSANRVKLVSGNTSSGVYRELDFHDSYIDLRGIPEMNVIKRDDNGIEIGAAITISRVIELLREESRSTIFVKLADHMEKVASKFIQNMASIGGNLVMAQRDNFESDIATILLGASSTVSVLLGSEKKSVTLEEFLHMPPCTDKFLLLSIYIPSWLSSHNVLFQTYRAASRPLGNAVAYANASFLAQILVDEKTGDTILDNVLLAFGAYGTEHASRARKVENFLKGKPVNMSSLLQAVRLLRQTLVVKEGTRHAAYRLSLAISFLFKFLSPLTKSLIKPEENGRVAVERGGKYSFTEGSMNGNSHDANQMLLYSKQKVELSTEYLPVGAATKKTGAEMQASGEAVYVDDIPSPRDCLYGAFIYSSKPFAHVKGIRLSSSADKVVSVISANDIPKEGSNVGACTIFGSEPLFPDSMAEYAGQPIGLVVAETQRFANLAAGHAVVNYSTDDLEPPILTLEEAAKRSSYFVVPPFLYPQQIGDFSKGMEEADHKIISCEVSLSSQYWFYMETQTALAVPDEDNSLMVYTSSQTPETAQNVIATCLGIPCHSVRVITRRVGGGFGGKAVRALPVAVACALAAYRLRRPVRMYLDRKTDMIISGGRHPMKVTYSVGFKSDGKITALHLDILIDAGATQDISPVIPHNLVGPLKKYNWGALSFDIKVCKTNLCTKSAMRAPGEVQGSYIAEAVIENVASFLSLDVNLIREKNLHSYESLSLFYKGIVEEPSEYTLPSLISNLLSTTRYRDRVEGIQSFNRSNIWRKRGIACVPIVHSVMLRPTPGKVSVLNDGSIVVEVGGIELGQGLWTKVKQMAAFGLGQLGQLGLKEGDDLLEKIRVIQADTLSMIQGGWTTGSTTSESSCEAIRLSCDILVERLKPIKESLEAQNGSPSWNALIKQASMANVNLSASAYWVPSITSMCYLNYGAAISEVEVDILSGATTILRSDLTYDCGQSLNPAVDLGQVEGAFVQGIGYFMLEEYMTNSDGLVTSDGTWTYKIPTIDTIPKEFNVELVNSGHHKNRVLSSKASGEPPLLLASSVHSATRDAIKAARAQLFSFMGTKDCPLQFQLPVPATMAAVKELCGFDHVELYLEALAFR